MKRLFVFSTFLPLLLAQPRPAEPSPSATLAVAAAKPTPDDQPVVRPHTLAIAGKTLNYTTTTGMMPIRNAAGETEAHIFFIAYTLDGTTDPAKRRLLFSFNGGPGSSSVWRHGAVIIHWNALGAKCSQMQPHRGGTGAAVEGKQQSALCRIRSSVQGIGNEKHVGFCFPARVADWHHARGCGVIQRFPGDGQCVLTHYWLIFWSRLGRRHRRGRRRRLFGRAGLS